MARRKRLGQKLILNLTVGVIAFGVVMLALAIWTEELVAERAAGRLISNIEQRSENAFLEIHSTRLRVSQVAQSWLRHHWSGDWREDEMERVFVPLLEAFPVFSSVMLGRDSGELYVLTRSGDQWLSSLLKPDVWRDRVRTRQWSDNEPTPATGWADSDFSVFDSPWFTFPLRLYQSKPNAPLHERIHIGDPRQAVATGEVGPLISSAFTRGDESIYVLALQTRLDIVTEVVRAFKMLEHGQDAILYGDPTSVDNLIFLAVPDDPKVGTIDLARPYLLQPSTSLEGPLRDFLHLALDQQYHLSGAPVRFESDGEHWWGVVRELSLFAEAEQSTTQPIWLAAVNKEQVLLEDIPRSLVWIIATTLVIVLFTIWRSIRLAGAIGGPIERLVTESRRMQRLSFDRRVEVDSDIVEIGILAGAMESMRKALSAYVTVSEEKRITDSIAQSNLPPRLPSPAGYDIGALLKPAEERSGAFYDLISRTGGSVAGDAKDSDRDGRLFALMADTETEGLEAAMIGVRLRTVFATGVRTGLSLEALAQELSSCLERETGGAGSARFWVAELDTEANRLSYVCSGYGLILRYLDRDGRVKKQDPTDSDRWSGTLEPGDRLLAVTSGAVDALNIERRRFGEERLEQLLLEQRNATNEQFIAQLQQALERFCAGSEQLQDICALAIRRS